MSWSTTNFGYMDAYVNLNISAQDGPSSLEEKKLLYSTLRNIYMDNIHAIYILHVPVPYVQM